MSDLKPTNIIVWRLDAHTEQRFWELVKQLEQLTEGSDESYAIKDEIRALPGHPTRYDPIRDLIVRELISTPLVDFGRAN